MQTQAFKSFSQTRFFLSSIFMPSRRARLALHAPSTRHTPRSPRALRTYVKYNVKCIMQDNLIPRSSLRYVHKHLAVGSLGKRLNGTHTVG